MNVIAKTNIVIITVIIATLTNTTLCAQSKPSRKAQRLYNEALADFHNNDLNHAFLRVNDCLATDSCYIDARLLKADILASLKQFKEAAVTNINTAAIDTTRVSLYLNAGRLFMRCGEYNSASDAFSNYLNRIKNKSKYQYADSLLNACMIAQTFVDNKYEIKNHYSDSLINTDNDEFINALSSDETTLFFTRRHSVRGFINEDIMSAKRENIKDNQFDNIESINDLLTLEGNEGAVTLSPDGSILFFTACGREDGMGSCDLYYSQRLNDHRWSAPKNLGPSVNSKYWESQPCMSSDGRTLFFSSNRPGGYGAEDIWYTRLNDDGTFSEAKNIGNQINTEYKELSPFIHFDGITLYFSSDRPNGLGGLDLWMLNMQNDTVATNLGYPINDFNDQMNFVVSPSGRRGYISTVNDFGNDYDIISFDIPENLKPVPTVCKPGIVIDALTYNPVSNVRIDLTEYNAETKDGIVSNSDENGQFIVCMKTYSQYGITVVAPNYMIYSALIEYDTDTIVVRMQPLEIGKPVIINNVQFEYDSYELKSESFPELNRIVKMMKDNETLSFDIYGHTDNAGEDNYNQRLSEKRAQTVYDYLVSMGISASRLTYKGFGATKPVAPNDSEEGRKLNRRTEIVPR